MVFRVQPYDGKDTVETGLNTFRPISAPSASSRANAAIGGALEDLGQQGQRLGLTLAVRAEEDKNKAQKWEAEKSMLDFLEVQRERLDTDAQNITESGAGFYVGYHNKLKEDAAAWVDTLPEEQRAEYEVRVMGSYDTLLNQAAGVEAGTRQHYLKNLVERKVDGVRNGITSGMVSADFAMKDANEFVSSLGLPPNAATALQNTMGRAVESSFLERQAAENPAELYKALEPFGSGTSTVNATPIQKMIVDQANANGLDPRTMLAIAAQESGFKADAKAKGSTAEGLWQFTRALQKQLGIQNANDPALQTEAAMMYFQDMRQRLTANNIPERPDTMYAAHFLGIGGAIAVYGAGDDAKFYDVYASVAGSNIAKQAIAGNGPMFPNGADTTVGEVKAKIASVMGKRLEEVGGFVSDVPTNPPQDIEIDGRKFQFITGSDAAEFYGKARAELQRKSMAQLSALRKIKSDDGYMNPYDRFDRGALDKASREAGEPSLIIGNQDEGWAKAVRYIDQYGILPKSMSEAAMSHLNSADPKAKQKAYEILSAVHTKDPVRGLENSGVVGEVKRRIEKYEAMVSVDGVSPFNAYSRIEKEADPTYAEMIKKDKDKVNKATSRRSFNEVSKAFNLHEDGWFSENDYGSDAVKRLMTDDYQRYFRQSMEDGLSEDTAKAMAVQQMTQTYGKTEVMGKPRFMRFPPERVYPKVGGNISYVKDQATEYVNDVLERSGVKETVKPEQIFLQSSAQTGRDARAGRSPRYSVYYKDADGVFQEITGQWAANPERAARDFASYAAHQEIFGGDVPKGVDIANVRQTMKKKKHYVPGAMGVVSE